MKTSRLVLKTLLALATLSACSAPSMMPGPSGLRPGPMPRQMNQFQRFAQPARMARMSSGGSKLPFGLGMNTLGAQPMRDSGPRLFDAEDGLTAFGRRPEKVDLRAHFPPVYNQGATNACVGFASVGGLGEYYARKRGWNQRFSPRYLWNIGRHMEGTLNQNVGMMLTDGQKILDNYGMLPEQAFPFPVLDPQQDPDTFQKLLTERPNSKLIAEAKKYRFSQGWKTVDSVSAMRTSLAKGKPVVFGIAVFSNISETGPDGLIPMPGPNDQFMGGHAVVAVGYDNTRRVIILRNSWGSGWGENGYGYLPYDFFRGVVDQIPAYAGFTVK